MSVPSSESPKDHTALKEFHALVLRHGLSLVYDHPDGVDASIDAIRDPFVVYGEQGDAYTELIEAHVGYSNKRGVRSGVSQEQKVTTYKSFLCSSNEILKTFIQKA